MARSPEFDITDAAELFLVEAIDRRELALVPVCPEPAPAPSAAQLARARACLGVDEDFHWLDQMHETSGERSRQTRH